MKREQKMRALAGLFGLALAAFLLYGCDQLLGKEDEDDGGSKNTSGIDYENHLTGYSIKVKNDANEKLVAFKGAPSASTLIGGGEHGLKKDAALFATTGDFVLFLVKEQDYVDNKSNLSALANRPFTRVYAFYNASAENKLVYTISGFLGGSKKIILQNDTSYNVELRKDGIQGELIGYAGAGSANTTFSVESGGYNVFPIFRKYNSSRGEIISVYPKYNTPGQPGDGKAKFQRFELNDQDNEATLYANQFVGADLVLKTGSAYLLITNNNPNGITLMDGQVRVTTSTGGQIINSNRSLIFQINMPNMPGKVDEYLDSTTKAQYRISTDMHFEQVPSFVFESDKIYSLEIGGTSPYNITLSDITETGTMTFD